MSSKEVSEEDILYVAENSIRNKILEALKQEKEYVKLGELCKQIDEKRSKVNFHCKGLKERALIDRKIVSNRLYIRITEKGIKTIQELNKRRREKGINVEG